ncbi:MAG: hypothetical protein ACREC5_02365 [Thermoplasmata archaeon]
MKGTESTRELATARKLSSLRSACESAVYASLRLTRLEASEEHLSIPQVFILQALSQAGPIPIT